MNSFVRDAVKTVGPSVVRIDCEREINPLLSILSPDKFNEGDVIKVSGSGVVFSTDGYILTNAHVVQGSKKIVVTLSNGRSFKATHMGSDELTDLAVLKAETGNIKLSKAPCGDSGALQQGDWLIAMGCPVGLDFTVTLGAFECESIFDKDFKISVLCKTSCLSKDNGRHIVFLSAEYVYVSYMHAYIYANIHTYIRVHTFGDKRNCLGAETFCCRGRRCSFKRYIHPDRCSFE
jgi:hypothetical protein